MFDSLKNFLNKAVEVHGDKYDYSKIVTLNSLTDKVEIVCPTHGSFFQRAAGHIHTKNGCHKCASEASRGKKIEESSKNFLNKATEVHGDKYDYSKVVYVNTNSKVEIVCPTHGSFFQTPNNHSQGQGCPSCAKKNAPHNLENTTGFIERAFEKHGDKYDYSKVSYSGCHDKVEIVCPTHGSFFQTPNRHLYGDGCPSCGKECASIRRATGEKTVRKIIKMDRGSAKKDPARSKRDRFKEFLDRAEEVHCGKYDYSKSLYINGKTEVEIVCPTHGSFFQKPAYHVNNGNGCPKCKTSKISAEKKWSQDTFLNVMNEAFSGKYDFSRAVYGDNENVPVEIVCPEHGSFLKTPKLLKLGGGCPKCKETEIERKVRCILEEIGVEFNQFDRSVLPGKTELDFFLAKHKLAIECHGNYWHSSAVNKSEHWKRNHMLDKMLECRKLGITLLQFYSDEIINKPEIVKEIIRIRVGKSTDRIYARKTLCQRIDDNSVTKKFLDKHHLQGGNTRFDTSYGLYHREELVAVMCFGRGVSNRNTQREGEVELVRFASSKRIVGGASKLLSTFVINSDGVESIFSYSDNRISDGNVYRQLGFEKDKDVAPSYYYIGKATGGFENRVHKSAFKKSNLDKLFGLKEGETEIDCAERNGLYRIYNAGLQKFRIS